MKKYYKDYEPDSKVLDNGKVVKHVIYKGDYYQCIAEFKDYERHFGRLLAMAVIYTVLFVGIGLINSPGGRNFAVFFPYFGSFLPMAYLWTALFGRVTLIYNSRNSSEKETIQKMEFARYERTYCRTKRCAIAMTVLMGIASVASLILIFMHIGKDGMIEEMLFFAGAVCMALDANLIRIENGRLSYRKIQNEDSKQKNE